MKKMKKTLVLGAIFAVAVTGFTGCATHLEVIGSKLPGKPHDPSKDVYWADSDSRKDAGRFYPYYTGR